jgi:hypothetical protein
MLLSYQLKFFLQGFLYRWDAELSAESFRSKGGEKAHKLFFPLLREPARADFPVFAF